MSALELGKAQFGILSLASFGKKCFDKKLLKGLQEILLAFETMSHLNYQSCRQVCIRALGHAAPVPEQELVNISQTWDTNKHHTVKDNTEEEKTMWLILKTWWSRGKGMIRKRGPRSK